MPTARDVTTFPVAGARGFTAQLARFVVVGGLGFLINAGVYSGLVLLGVHYLLASGAGWILGVLNSYMLNRYFTFRSTAPVAGEFLRTFLVYVVQLAVSWAGLALLVEVVGLDEFSAYAANVIVVTLVSFAGLKFFAFRHQRAA